MTWSFVTGLSIGLLGSFHCIGMCGPIALSLPVHRMATVPKHLNILLYNLGRALTYALLGALFGLLGNSFQIFGLQQFLSIFGGITILALAWIYYYRPAWLSSGKIGTQVSSRLSKKLAQDKSHLTFLSIGLLNGFLPCGLVYMALASAFATGTPTHGAILMFFFGLGTLPLMYVFMLSSQWITASARNYLRKIIPVWIAVLGVLMILRGLNLGIPYISPSMNSETNQVENCCGSPNDQSQHEHVDE